MQQVLGIENRETLNQLRRRWTGIAVVFVATVLAGAWLLRTAWSPLYAQRWLLIAGVIVARELWLLWKGLASNHRADDARLLPTLGYGNGLTIARGLLLALLAGFIFSPWPVGWLAWAPAVLYTAAAVLDHLDGYVARITNHSTKLGEMLDMEYDVIGIFAAVLLAIFYGQLPVWYLGIGLAREIFLAGHWVLRKLGKPVYDLPPSSDRRLIAGLQMGFLSVVLWPVLSPPATTLGAVLFALPMVVSFGRDWMVTSGAWDVNTPSYIRRRRFAKRLLEQWIPTAARAVGTVVAAGLLWREAPAFAGWQAALGLGPGPLWAWVGLVIGATALFALGVAGRLAALVLIAAACVDIAAHGFSWTDNALLLAGAILVLQFGSGQWALWQPEERLLRHRAGERPEATA
jgi:CDP-diacylglycerol--glycerol-3-phosphate 3-phosphatidyltransferase